MGRYSGKTCRLICMLALTFSFFLVEIVTGYITNSLALVGDSYHMLSDVVALLVGFASVRISRWQSQKNTYGWARAEVVGALVNSVFLIALCFTIFVEALQRLTTNEEIKDEMLLLIVGCIGLTVNLIGLALFHGHAHSHGGGGHSHGSGGHSHKEDKEETKHLCKCPPGEEHSHPLEEAIHDHSEGQVCSAANGQVPHAGHGSSESESETEIDVLEPQIPAKLRSSAQLNMRGVFLHVLGDALGSVIVIISALVIKYGNGSWVYKVDPAMSMVMVIIILSTTIPLLKESALILLQTVPTHIQVASLKEKLIQKVEGVLAVHEFHVWQLAGNRIIATAHIRCRNLRDYMKVAEDVKNFFHNHGIHSTTIQPEFVEFEELAEDRDCVLECGPDKTCFPDTCCGSKRASKLFQENQANGTHSADSITNNDGIRQRNNAPAVSNSAPDQGTGDGVPIHSNNCLLRCPDECSELCCCRPDKKCISEDEPNHNPNIAEDRGEAQNNSRKRGNIRKRSSSDGSTYQKPRYTDTGQETCWTEDEERNHASSFTEKKSPFSETKDRVQRLGNKLSDSLKHLAHTGSSDLKEEEERLVV